MDSHSRHLLTNEQYKGASYRVHINPNFNKDQQFTNTTAKPMSRLHVNPAFSLQRVAAAISQDKNIHINPNFVSHRPPHRGSLAPPAPAAPAEDTVVSCSNQSHLRYRIVKNLNTTESTNLPNETAKDLSNQSNVLKCPHLSKSRYSLVRHKVNKPQNKTSAGQSHSLLKISKYTSVRVNTVRNTIESIKALNTKTNYKYLLDKMRNPELIVTNKSQEDGQAFKLYKPTMLLRNKPLSRYKIVKKKSIPCPLFVKYGKCLRQMRGGCPYLHDKKHVSICRNLLKGRCFDNNCRFSHELTSNRMPTCYFYLNGVCTKENCPYLHVKLNENACVCPDFQKGYCENGANCMKRHLFTKSMCTNEISVYKNVPYNQQKIKPCKMKVKQEITKKKSDKAVVEGRYYKESEGNMSCYKTWEIKPKRCKLGDLPSFIQL